MADREVPVVLRADVQNLSARLRHMAEQADRWVFDWTLREATWEPHDWSAF
jgi:hypothetical protein